MPDPWTRRYDRDAPRRIPRDIEPDIRPARPVPAPASDWAGWARVRRGRKWHQVDQVAGHGYHMTAWFPCLARRIPVTDVLDYRATPPGQRCRHVLCQKPGD